MASDCQSPSSRRVVAITERWPVTGTPPAAEAGQETEANKDSRSGGFGKRAIATKEELVSESKDALVRVWPLWCS